ncbi:MAG: LysR family transcriptional regulator [Burkholderiales bacterium]
MDKLRSMAVFVAIADRGSLTAAAVALDMSLPAVVRSLAVLESALGVRLANRTTRRLALTEEGHEYLTRCRRVLTEVDEAEAALTVRAPKPSGRLAITASVRFGRLHVAPLVNEYLRANAGVSAELLLLDRVVDLIEEGLDIGVRLGRLRESSLVAVPVGGTSRVVCASVKYLRGAGPLKAPEDLRAHRAIRFTGVTPGRDWAFRREGRTIHVSVAGPLVTNQIDVAIDACANGLGVATFLRYQVEDALAAGTLCRVLEGFEPPPVPISVVYPHARLLAPRVRVFLDWFVPRLRDRMSPHFTRRAVVA